MSSYPVKWKGQSSGPYSIDELRKKFEDREIGAMHEVFVDGHWMTLRAFFRRHPEMTNQPSAQADVKPRPQEVSPEAYLQQVAFSPMPVPPLHISPSTGATYGHSMSPDEPSGQWLNEESVSLVFAGFWFRVMALLIDGILVFGAPIWILDFYLEREILTVEALQTLTAAQWGIFSAIAGPCAMIYFAVFECSPMQATIGKHCLGLVVISTSGERISFANALLRFFAKLGSASMGFVGFFLAAFSSRKQTFHDMMAQTYVCLRIENNNFFSRPNRKL